MEDLSLKYLEHDAYYMIKENLNATKRSRDAYIEKFIAPLGEKLAGMGIKCHIKGRTKSRLTRSSRTCISLTRSD